jgi:hypothetical protein
MNAFGERVEGIKSILRLAIHVGFECTAERLVLSKGREFFGIKRPKGFRLMASKQCFRNAFILASEERGCYCEGFAASLTDGIRFRHAWVSRGDGAAIDVTLRNPEEYVYLGLQFSQKSFLTLANAGYGKCGFLRPPLDEALLRRLIC